MRLSSEGIKIFHVRPADEIKERGGSMAILSGKAISKLSVDDFLQN